MDAPKEIKELFKLIKELEALENTNAKLAADLLKSLKELKPIPLLGEDCLKDYMAAVKQSDGLTSLRPSVVKDINAVADEPTASAVKSALSGLKKHAADVEKENAKDIKSDKKKAKQVGAFVDELEAVCGRLSKQRLVG